MSGNPYRGHRFPREIISYAVWFYYRFAASFRDVEDAMAARGVLVSYETVRRWCDKFGHLYAAGLRRRVPGPGDKWHLDEIFLHINGVGASVAGRRSERYRHRHSPQPGGSVSPPCASSADYCRPPVIAVHA